MTAVVMGAVTAKPAEAVAYNSPVTVSLAAGTPGSASDIAVGPSGVAYVLDATSGKVITIDGSTVTASAAITGLSATASGIAVNGTTLYIADTGNHRVISVPTTGTPTVTTVAGTLSTFGAPTQGPAASSLLHSPKGLAWDAANSALYIADTGNNRVEKVVGTALSYVAGTGAVNTPTAGPAISSQLSAPQDVAVDADGNLYIADTGNKTLEKVSTAGTLSVLTTTFTSGPSSVSADAAGTVFAADGTALLTVPSTGGAPSALATLARTAGGLATSADGSLWVADDNTTTSQVLRISPNVASAPPHITSVAPTKAVKGVALSRSFSASGFPTPTWSIVGTLPTGVTSLAIGTATGVLTGTPTVSGPLTFTVRASNGVGVGYDDQVVTLVVGSVPAAIAAAPTVAASQGSATVTWTAPPAPTGDAATLEREAVTGYVVTPYVGTTAGTAKTSAAGTLSTTISGLKSGTAYTFTVAATNAFGTGVASAASAAVTPYGGIKEPPVGLTRYEGGNRVATAVKVSQQLYPDTGSARAVVVASSTSFADSLAGARLASAVGGPLLLTDPLALNSEVAAEVGRVLAVPATTATAGAGAGAAAGATTAKATTMGTVYLLGGTSAVSAEVETAVKAVNTKYAVTRISGTDRFETATKIAAQVTADDPVAGAPVYVASGTNYPDGLAVAALAARTGGVLLLTDGATMPSSTLKYLETRDPNSELLVAVGGPAAAATSGHGAERAIVGSDRYDTARKVAARFTAASGSKAVRSVGLATGQNWPDALAGAAAMGNLGGPLLLTPQGSLSPSVSSAVTSLSSAGKPSSALVFGGSSVVSTSASDAFAALVK